MSNNNIEVKEVTIDGYTQFVATLKLIGGTIIRIAAATPEAAIAEVEKEARYASSYNPNQGMSFAEDEEDYYS
jgi:hypothetical protein